MGTISLRGDSAFRDKARRKRKIGGLTRAPASGRRPDPGRRKQRASQEAIERSTL